MASVDKKFTNENGKYLVGKLKELINTEQGGVTKDSFIEGTNIKITNGADSKVKIDCDAVSDTKPSSGASTTKSYSQKKLEDDFVKLTKTSDKTFIDVVKDGDQTHVTYESDSIFRKYGDGSTTFVAFRDDGDVVYFEDSETYNQLPPYIRYKNVNHDLHTGLLCYVEDENTFYIRNKSNDGWKALSLAPKRTVTMVFPNSELTATDTSLHLGLDDVASCEARFVFLAQYPELIDYVTFRFRINSEDEYETEVSYTLNRAGFFKKDINSFGLGYSSVVYTGNFGDRRVVLEVQDREDDMGKFKVNISTNSYLQDYAMGIWECEIAADGTYDVPCADILEKIETDNAIIIEDF